jgi:uncharacterized ferritin-like protein (DUF455 family)
MVNNLNSKLYSFYNSYTHEIDDLADHMIDVVYRHGFSGGPVVFKKKWKALRKKHHEKFKLLVDELTKMEEGDG